MVVIQSSEVSCSKARQSLDVDTGFHFFRVIACLSVKLAAIASQCSEEIHLL